MVLKLILLMMIIQLFFYDVNLNQDFLFLISFFKYVTKFIFSHQQAYELKQFTFILFGWKFKYVCFSDLLMVTIVWIEL